MTSNRFPRAARPSLASLGLGLLVLGAWSLLLPARPAGGWFGTCGGEGQAPCSTTRYYMCGTLWVCTYQDHYCDSGLSTGSDGKCHTPTQCDLDCITNKITNYLGPPTGDLHNAYHGKQVGRDDVGIPSSTQLHLDVGGLGRYCNAQTNGWWGYANSINLNPSSYITTADGYVPTDNQCPSTDRSPDRQVAHYVYGSADDLPFKAEFFDCVTLENAPFDAQVIAQVTRVLRAEGTISVYGPTDAYTSGVRTLRVQLGVRPHTYYDGNNMRATFLTGSSNKCPVSLYAPERDDL